MAQSEDQWAEGVKQGRHNFVLDRALAQPGCSQIYGRTENQGAGGELQQNPACEQIKQLERKREKKKKRKEEKEQEGNASQPQTPNPHSK